MLAWRLLLITSMLTSTGSPPAKAQTDCAEHLLGLQRAPILKAHSVSRMSEMEHCLQKSVKLHYINYLTKTNFGLDFIPFASLVMYLFIYRMIKSTFPELRSLYD